MHAISDCERFETDEFSHLKVNVIAMMSDATSCDTECFKLNELVKWHKKMWKMEDLSRKIVKIKEDNIEPGILCIAPTRQNLDIYRVKYLDSGVVVNMNMKQLYKMGNMWVKSGPQALEDHLLN